jgi:hypothetical protein
MLDIKNGHVRFQLICLFHRFLAVHGFADDCPAALSAKEVPYAASHELVAIRDQDTKSLRAPSHPGIVTRTLADSGLFTKGSN